MSIDGVLLTQIVGMNMIVLMLGLFIVRVAPISLKSFQGVYLLLGAANVTLHHFYLPQVDILWLLLPLAVGILVLLVATAVLGKMKSSVHYETLLVSVGLFPWYLGWMASIVYILMACIFIALIYCDARYRSMRKVHRKMTTPVESLEDVLKDHEYANLLKKLSLIFTTQVGLGAIAAATVISVSFS